MSVTISNTNTSTEPTSTTTIIPSKEIQIQCPTTAEQKDTESIAEDASSDYNPNDETDPESEDVSSDDQQQSEEEESANGCENYEQSQEEIVNSIEFEQEFADAIENVLYISKIDGQKILEKVAQEYTQETGNEPTEQQIVDAFETIAIDPCQQEESAFEEEVEVSEEEYAEAIENVKELAKCEQEEFVNRLCDTFVELTGKEPSIDELSNVFEMIKDTFAEEAREDFIEINDAEDDSDSDYQPNEEDLKQIKKDNKICKKQKTQIVYVNDDSETESDSEFDSEEEEETESEFDSEEDIKEDASEEDDNDEDYDPENDAFDYSQDAEDDVQFKNELKGTDENQVECEQYEENDDEETIDID